MYLRFTKFGLNQLAIAGAGSLWFWAIIAGLPVMTFDKRDGLEVWAFIFTIRAYLLFPLLIRHRRLSRLCLSQEPSGSRAHRNQLRAVGLV